MRKVGFIVPKLKIGRIFFNRLAEEWTRFQKDDLIISFDHTKRKTRKNYGLPEEWACLDIVTIKWTDKILNYHTAPEIDQLVKIYTEKHINRSEAEKNNLKKLNITHDIAELMGD